MLGDLGEQVGHQPLHVPAGEHRFDVGGEYTRGGDLAERHQDGSAEVCLALAVADHRRVNMVVDQGEQRHVTSRHANQGADAGAALLLGRKQRVATVGREAEMPDVHGESVPRGAAER
jgi:hypothetical protein